MQRKNQQSRHHQYQDDTNEFTSRHCTVAPARETPRRTSAAQAAHASPLGKVRPNARSQRSHCHGHGHPQGHDGLRSEAWNWRLRAWLWLDSLVNHKGHEEAASRTQGVCPRIIGVLQHLSHTPRPHPIAPTFPDPQTRPTPGLHVLLGLGGDTQTRGQVLRGT